jgi:hypothetical protein
MVMSSLGKFTLAICACLLGGGLLLLIFRSHEEEIASSGKSLGMQSHGAFEQPQTSEGHATMRKREELVADSQVKIDRSTPERALDAILKSLSSSRFDQFFESFSQTGKEKLTGGAEVDEQDLLSLNQSLAAAGFEGLRVVSEVVEHHEEFVVADVTVESKRRGRMITEELKVILAETDGEWFVDSFEVVNVPK